MKTTKTRLKQLAGLLKENADRDALAHYVWSKDELMDKSEDEIEDVIDELEQEYNASKANYSNVEDYIDDLENSGGFEGFLNEGMSWSGKSNINQRWKTADDMAGDMQQWLSGVYASGNEDMYEEVMNILANLADNFDPSDEL